MIASPKAYFGKAPLADYFYIAYTGVVTELVYNFTFAGENRGYSYLYADSLKLYSFTRFVLDRGEVFTNTFTLRLRDGRVLACKHGDRAWVDLSDQPPDHFPGCAYPLLLMRAVIGPYTYVQISDDDGSVIGETQLKREFDDIVESRDGVVLRTFTMEGEIPIRIDWGDAVSHLCSDGDESVQDTGLTFTIE